MQSIDTTVYTLCSVDLPEEHKSVRVIAKNGNGTFNAVRIEYDWIRSHGTADGWVDLPTHIHENDWWVYLKDLG